MNADRDEPQPEASASAPDAPLSVSGALDRVSNGALEADATSAEAPATPAAAVIVVHDRPHRWSASLVIPVLVLLSACALLSMRIHAPDWLGVLPGATVSKVTPEPRPEQPQPSELKTDTDESSFLPPGVLAAGVPATTVEVESVAPPESATPQPPPIAKPVVRLLPAESATAEIAPSTDRAADHSAINPAALPDLALDRAASEPPAAIEPPPAPEAEEVWADIQREAQSQKNEREALEHLKATLLDEELARKTLEDLKVRQEFLSELRSIVAKSGPGTAAAIRDLVDRAPAVKSMRLNEDELSRPLSTSKNLRRIWTLQQRAQGVSEIQILDVLERAHKLNAVSRDGPRSPDAALIRAAQEMLSLPIVIARPAPPAPRAAPVRADTTRRRAQTPLPPSRRRVGGSG